MTNRLFGPRSAEAPTPHLSVEPVRISPADELVVARLVRAEMTPLKLAECAQTILLAAAGTGVREIAPQLDDWPKTVRHWLRRWLTAGATLPLAKSGATPVAQRLPNAPRVGDRQARAYLRDYRLGLGGTGKAAENGAVGAIVRREAVYSSSLTDWR